MTRTPGEALRAAREQSEHGPDFGVGECKMRTRLLYDVASDGTPSASAAWRAADYRHPVLDVDAIPRGALVWWTGGSKGHGHVALCDGAGRVWSTDIKRPGRFDLVPVKAIALAWPNVSLVGWSEDIDGVRVITHPRRLGRYARARRLLLDVAADPAVPPARRQRARAALAALRKAPTA